ncbi:hypothetical protein [Frigoribacterium sp. PhB24]|uniref:hypothetical protein n=1 Tax=Frigoribacterium sp. PhB24 TaxID=2485204 RepID=UPI000F48F8BB|nr:hypothetical protein [Frigoribacterium sp. PhB24]ROS52919.1 hypothetical protein EDF50_1395 [Frigoribacterium sp. PhB24]
MPTSKGIRTVANTAAMQGPAQITAVAEDVDSLIPDAVAAVADLAKVAPLWPGRLMSVNADKTVWRNIDGTATGWKRIAGGHELSPWGTTTPETVDQPLFKARSATGTTNAGGVLGHTFSTPFPTACDHLSLTLGNQSGVGTAAPVVVDGSVTRTGFQTFWAGRGASPVGVFYLAVGH